MLKNRFRNTNAIFHNHPHVKAETDEQLQETVTIQTQLSQPVVRLVPHAAIHQFYCIA